MTMLHPATTDSRCHDCITVHGRTVRLGTYRCDGPDGDLVYERAAEILDKRLTAMGESRVQTYVDHWLGTHDAEQLADDVMAEACRGTRLWSDDRLGRPALFIERVA